MAIKFKERTMKRVLIFSLLIIFGIQILLQTNAFAASNKEYEYIHALEEYSIIQNVVKLNRAESITMICKLLGFTDEMAYQYRWRGYYLPPFIDVDSLYEYSGYIFKARDEGITKGRNFGEYEYLSPPGKPVMIPYFEPEEYVTYDEAIAFIMRCLEESELELKSTYSRAIERGLIVESDTFYNKHNEPVILEDMCLLLYRMLDQNCYKYFDDSIENPQQYTYRQLLEMKIQND